MAPGSARLECAAPAQATAPAWSEPAREWYKYFATQLPGGFGGLYLLESESVLGFRLVAMDRSAAVTDGLPNLLVNSPYAQFANLGMRPEQGRYDFLELAGCRDVVAAAIAKTSMVTSVGVREHANQIAVGVATAADSSAAIQTVASRFPADLVRIFVQPLVPPGS